MGIDNLELKAALDAAKIAQTAALEAVGEDTSEQNLNNLRLANAVLAAAKKSYDDAIESTQQSDGATKVVFTGAGKAAKTFLSRAGTAVGDLFKNLGWEGVMSVRNADNSSSIIDGDWVLPAGEVVILVTPEIAHG